MLTVTKRMQKPVVPESMVLAQCMQYLYLKKIFAWRNNTGAAKTEDGRYVRFGLPGASDIIGIMPDVRFLAVECKRSDGGRLSPQQKVFLDKIKEAGGVAVVAASLDDLREAIEKNER